MDAAAPQIRSTPERVGVVFVHGIGSQPRSETVRLFADPLVDWLRRWHDDPDRGRALSGKSIAITARLSYGEQLAADVPAHVRVRLPPYTHPMRGAWAASEWILTEGWWAARLEPPGLLRIAGWAILAYLRTLLRLFTAIADALPVLDPAAEAVGDRVKGVHMPEPPTEQDRRAQTARADERAARRREKADMERAAGKAPSAWSRVTGVLARVWGRIADAIGALIDTLSLLALLIVYAVVTPLGFFFAVLPLAILAQIPGLAERIGLFNVLKLFLTQDIGDFYTYLFDEIQALHVRDGVLKAVSWLVGQGCDRILVVGHSQGAVVAFDSVTQTDRDAPLGVARVTKLITLGEALNNAWALKPEALRRVRKGLPAIRWVDFWSYYDPVPGARPDIDMGAPAPKTSYEPIEVTNFMDVVAEHDGYFVNTEEFVTRLAQEIDTASPDREESRFWIRRFSAWDDRIERRRWRVRTLLIWRTIGIGLFMYSVLARGERLQEDGRAIAALAKFVPGLEDLGKLVASSALVGLTAIAEPALAVFAFAALFEFAYLLLVRPWWRGWDASVRNSVALTKLPAGRGWIAFVFVITVWTIVVFVEAASIVLRQQLLPF